MDIPPNQTIYINNLNEKLHKDVLKRALYSLFCQYGAVLDIVSMKTPKMRGQAFVVFRDIPAASTAMRSLQGFMFYDKPMRIAFAKTKSQIITGKKSAAAANGANGELPNAMDTTEAITDGAVKTHVLCLQNLPDNTEEADLVKLFAEMEGYKEVRTVPGRSEVAFVEFDSEANATTAQNALQGFKLSPTHSLEITFGQ